MSSGTQIDPNWTGVEAGQGGAAPGASAGARAHLTDEEILGIEPNGAGTDTSHTVIPSEARNPSSITGPGESGAPRDSSGIDSPRNDNSVAAGQDAGTEMPRWMQSAAADPQHGAAAQQLWREHQEFRAAFASPEEARAIKELLPGGVKDVLTLREATQSVERIDAAIFSGDTRAQSEVAAELARANPAAFRSLFAEAAKVLASLETGGSRLEAGDLAPRTARGGWGTQDRAEDRSAAKARQDGAILDEVRNLSPIQDGSRGTAQRDSPVAPASQALPRNDTARDGDSSSTPNFDPAAYAAFERSTNDAVARDVRGSIGETLARVLPDGVAEGAAKRIGDDIFNEIHRALAADRTLSEQVATVLRDRRFGTAEQRTVASLLAGRARQLVPSVARRVIGEWTGTVLNTSRSKAARQAAAASRIDIAAPGGSLDSMPLRQISGREVDYASMSDEEILGM